MSNAAKNRAARNPRLALSGYPVMLPHFFVADGGLYFGDSYLRTMDPDEAEFATLCDGRKTFREIISQMESAAGRAATAPYLTWLSEPLGAAPVREAPLDGGRWLVLSPHPDDAELSIGGTLFARPEGVDAVNVICFSDLLYTQFSQAFSQSFAVNAIRRDEALLAGAAMGVEVEFLGFPELAYRQAMTTEDAFLDTEKEIRQALKLRLLHVIRKHRPTHVFAPAGIGDHGDHRMIFDCVIEFVDDDIFPETTFHLFEDFPYSASQQAVDDFLSRFEYSYLDVVTHFQDTSAFAARKAAVTDIYRSQFRRGITDHVLRAGTRTAAMAAKGAPEPKASAERYWTIGVMGMGGAAG